MRISESDHGKLKNWLVSQLTSISTAEPAVLADYVIALVTNDTPRDELPARCVENLKDFLQGDTEPFVDSLIAALESGAYRRNGDSGHDSRDRPKSRRDENDEGNESSDDRDTHHRRRGRSIDDYDHRKRSRRDSRSRDRQDSSHSSNRRDDSRDNPRRRDTRQGPSGEASHRRGRENDRGREENSRDSNRRRMNGGGHMMGHGFDPMLPPEAFMFPPPHEMMLPPGMMPPPGFGLPPMMMPMGMVPPGMEGMMGGPRGVGRGGDRRGGPAGDRDRDRDRDRQQQRRPMEGGDASARFTIRCRGIPQNVSAAQLTQHFSQFGKVVTTQMTQGEERSGKIYLDAFVQFVSPESAKKSVSSPVPVLNNRFIKVMFSDQNIMDPSAVDESAIEALPEHTGESGDSGAPRTGDESQPKTGPSFSQTKTIKQYEQLKQLRQRQDDIAKQKEQLLQAQIDQYQAIVDKIKTGRPELADDAPELQQFTEKLQGLQGQLTRLKEGVEEVEEDYTGRGGAGRGVRGGRGNVRGRATRGRVGRGRGRGRATLSGASIDNRPKTLVITSPPDTFLPELAKSHFERFGEVADVTKQGDQLLVRFTARRSGDVALKSGTFYQGQHLNVGWHQDSSEAAAPSYSAAEETHSNRSDSDGRKNRYQGVLADVLGGGDELEEFDDDA